VIVFNPLRILFKATEDLVQASPLGKRWVIRIRITEVDGSGSCRMAVFTR